MNDDWAGMTDDELLAAIASGDHPALRELFERHAPWIAQRLRRVLPSSAVEDVLQDTFIAIWRGAGSYSGAGEAGGWGWGIARRQAALWLRRHGRPPVSIAAREGVDPANQAIARVDLERALLMLGEDAGEQRELARLVFAEDRSTAEVASLLGIPPGTVKSRIHTLRRRLRAALGGES